MAARLHFVKRYRLELLMKLCGCFQGDAVALSPRGWHPDLLVPGVPDAGLLTR
jgi:hypothetical protein